MSRSVPRGVTCGDGLFSVPAQYMLRGRWPFAAPFTPAHCLFLWPPARVPRRGQAKLEEMNRRMEDQQAELLTLRAAEAERVLGEHRAAVQLQQCARSRLARKEATARRQLRAERQAAALQLQSIHRGRVGRQKAEARREQREKEAAAVRLQCALRGQTSRKRVAALRQERDEQVAAVRLQAMHRGGVSRQA